MSVPIRRMEEHERAEVIAVTARAFWHDPLFDFFARDLLHEHRLLPAFFRTYFQDLRGPLAHVWVADHDGRPRGVAGWLAPGAFPRSVVHDVRQAVRSAPVVARVRNRGKAARLLLEIDRRHPRE
ncbi:MAG: hypothetical protein JWO68_208, partial [Actinomycetia bacterium]|nr:hypothetical protein [Actinomycetes bacterium]